MQAESHIQQGIFLDVILVLVIAPWYNLSKVCLNSHSANSTSKIQLNMDKQKKATKTKRRKDG